MALLREARHARPCAGHPRLCSIKQERRGWPGRSPAMTKKRLVFKLLGRARKRRLHFRSGSEERALARAAKDDANVLENALLLAGLLLRRTMKMPVGPVEHGVGRRGPPRSSGRRRRAVIATPRLKLTLGGFLLTHLLEFERGFLGDDDNLRERLVRPENVG